MFSRAPVRPASTGPHRPRATPLTAVPSAPGSSGRPVPSFPPQGEERGSDGGSASTLRSQVAPASDLQTGQLRLLPWQSSTSAGPAAALSNDGYSSSGEAAVAAASAAARRASGAAASTSGRSSPASAGQVQRRRRAAAGRTSGAAAGSVLASDSSSEAAPVAGAAAVHSSGSSSSQAGAAWPAARAGVLCEACGGRRFIVSVAGRGEQPCYACQQWRQRPDYQPGSALLSLQDVDLTALDGSSSAAGAGADEGGAPGASAALGAGPGGEGGALDGGEGAGSGSGSSSGDSPLKRQRRKSGPMSAERRAAISRALQNKGAKSEEHKRSISRAMREAHARNPKLRHVAAGQKKKCGHCGQEGHNRRACPQLLAGAAAVGASLRAAAQAAQAASSGASPSRMIFIEEVDPSPVGSASVETPGGTGKLPAAAAAAALAAAAEAAAAELGRDSGSGAVAAEAAGGGSPAASSENRPMPAAPAATSSSSSSSRSSSGGAEAAATQAQAQAHAPAGSNGSSSSAGLLPTVQMGPSVSLCPEGSWVFPLPQTKEECVAQAAQASLRAWDDGIRRQALELLLPQAHPTEDGGWPGGIRQQFRVAKPMVESLLLRLKEHSGLEGRITAELLDEGDCVGAWQSERLAAVLFATADTLPDLRRIDDALSGERLTLVINPQWQTQGQVISDFGIGKARKSAERFISAFEEVYYLRRVRVFGDDVRIMRCYPGQWQVHYVPPSPREETVLLSCEDRKPTFQRLIELLKSVQGSRASKSWLDRFLTSSMGTFNEFAAYSPEGAPPPYSSDAASTSGGAAGAAAEAAAQQLQQQPPQQPPQQAAAGAALLLAQPAQPPLVRDIVTGEVIPGLALEGELAPASHAGASGGSPGSPAGAAAAAGSLRRDAGKPAVRVHVEPVRDVRLEPVREIARWLGSEPIAGPGPAMAAAAAAEQPQQAERRRRSKARSQNSSTDGDRGSNTASSSSSGTEGVDAGPSSGSAAV